MEMQGRTVLGGLESLCETTFPSQAGFICGRTRHLNTNKTTKTKLITLTYKQLASSYPFFNSLLEGKMAGHKMEQGVPIRLSKGLFNGQNTLNTASTSPICFKRKHFNQKQQETHKKGLNINHTNPLGKVLTKRVGTPKKIENRPTTRRTSKFISHLANVLYQEKRPFVYGTYQLLNPPSCLSMAPFFKGCFLTEQYLKQLEQQRYRYLYNYLKHTFANLNISYRKQTNQTKHREGLEQAWEHRRNCQLGPGIEKSLQAQDLRFCVWDDVAQGQETPQTAFKNDRNPLNTETRLNKKDRNPLKQTLERMRLSEKKP